MRSLPGFVRDVLGWKARRYRPPHLHGPAGLAAGRNLRSYPIQSYARDIGNGKTIMMREIDVPVRVNGRLWGSFRTAYKL